MQSNGIEMWQELNIWHPEIEALQRLENPSPTKQPPPSSPLWFIPVNMLCYLWKGLIQRIFCGIMTVYSTSSQPQETKEWQGKVIVCLQMLLIHLRSKMNNTESWHIFRHKYIRCFWKYALFMRNVFFVSWQPSFSLHVKLRTLVLLLLSKSLTWFDSMLITQRCPLTRWDKDDADWNGFLSWMYSSNSVQRVQHLE